MRSRLSLIAPLAVLCFSLPAFAFQWGIGVEGAGTSTTVSNPVIKPDGTDPAGSGNFGVGLILEQRMALPLVFGELWEDIQTPLPLQTGGSDTAGYIPIDVGLRIGLGLGPIEPYVGVLGQGLFLNSKAPIQIAPLNSSVFGAGGDLGIDLSLFFLHFGLEGRLTHTLTDLVSGGGNPNGATIFQLLLSARLFI